MKLAILTKLFSINVKRGRLFWKNPSKYVSYLKGKEAGSIRICMGKQYCVVMIDGKDYLRGRLIFYIAHRRWPTPEVDHKNGNSLDDRLYNLREATHKQNCRNKKRIKERSLPMGVTQRCDDGRIQAQIRVNDKLIHLGTFSTVAKAEKEYKAARRRYFGKFA